jgi:4-hydroxybenzoyl-CoA thioesterase
MSKPIEDTALIDQTAVPDLPVPFIYRRRIRFGESDAARIAYTGQFPMWALEAVEEWCDIWGGADWYEINVHRGFGTPFVHISVDIEAPLRPKDVAEMKVFIPKVGRSSITWRVECFRPDGVRSFVSNMVCVTAATEEMKSIPIPPDFRARIDAYRAACGET